MKKRGASYSVVAEHNRVVADRGEAAVGKFGGLIGASAIVRLKRQIQNGEDTFLYLVVREGGELVAYRALLKDVGLVERSQRAWDLFPTYYDDMCLVPTSFLRIGGELQPDQAGDLVLASTGSNLFETLRRCRTTQMLVRAG